MLEIEKCISCLVIIELIISGTTEFVFVLLDQDRVSIIRKYHNKKTRGTARKSHTTITRQQDDKLSKATSCFVPIKMIAKL